MVYAVGPATMVQGGGGALLFVGGPGSATVTGGSGGSLLAYAAQSGGIYTDGTAGNNLLVAAAGNTTLNGGGGVLFGPATVSGAVLEAGAGTDTLIAGATTLTGGNGSDVLFLGTGPDHVVAGTAGSVEVVVGFDPTRDTLSLAGASPAAALAGASTGAWGTTLALPDGTSITLIGVSALRAASMTS